MDEHDLTREFWSVSSRQRPRRHLHGIRADDLPGPPRPSTSNARPVSPLTPSELDDEAPPHIATPVEPIGSLDDAMFDNLSQSSATRVDSVRTPSLRRTAAGYPKRHSSMNALNQVGSETLGSRSSGPTFYESDSSNSGGHTTPEVVPTVSTQVTTLALSPPNVKSVEIPDPEDIDYRSKQPLPPVPKSPPTVSGRPRKSSTRSLNTTHASSTSLQPPSKQAASPKSKRSSIYSSRSSRSAGLSLSHSSLLDMRQSTNISDTTWEDDVDFIYAQEAESTCNFNWNVGKSPCWSPVENESEQRPISAAYHAHSPTIPLGETNARPVNDSKETIAERRRSRKADRAPRASSVGHRGFLAARRSSQELQDVSNPVGLTPSSSHASLLSPVFSINGAEEDAGKTPFTPATFQYTGIQRASSDFLSDPESYRNSGSTQHRKSSSYGSHESRGRPPPNPARDTNRWSMVSANSLPELMHSRPRSKVILSKAIISKPLEVLPQSPPFEFDSMESPIVPREFQTQPVRNSFVMRMPQAPSDPDVQQSAEKFAQGREPHVVTTPRTAYSHRREYSIIPADDNVPGWI